MQRLDTAMSKKYNIHPDFARFPVFSFRFNSVIVATLNLLIRTTRWLGKRSYSLDTQYHTLVSADGGSFDIMVMKPYGLRSPAPALLYYHGGAFAMTYASNHLQSCERYANEAGCVVILVAYRLAPRHPFPCAFDDCYAALQWAVAGCDSLGLDRHRIAVGGDSAGGALAAGVAQRARDPGTNNWSTSAPSC